MRIRNRNGQAVVEMALMLPVICLLLFGLIEFGRVWYIKNTLNFAAREGARAAVCYTGSSLSADAVKTVVTGILPSSFQTGLVVNITPTSPQRGKDNVQVKVSIPFTTILPVLLPQLKSITTLSGITSMRYE